ncbi:MAG: metallopeptidase TldD-related protein [Bryobacteraceae bacterium]|nr:metallopeptidase TldD-related protein [Bryobacteraceae bacterium]
MMTRDQVKQLTEKVLKFSSFPECSVNVNEIEEAFVRFANNGVTTAGFTVDRTVRISSVRDGRTGTTSTTDLTDEALKAAVKRSEELAAVAPPNPERVDPLGLQKYADYENWDDKTANARSPVMTPHVKAIIDAALAKKLVAAGFFTRSAGAGGFANNTGNFGYQRQCDSRLTTTVRNADGSSSGWACQPSVRIGEISGADLGGRAIEKCTRWTKPEKLDPGKYTVVLEPTAVADIGTYLGFSFSARSAEEGRSFLSKKGGGTLVGDKMFPDHITLRSDPFDKRVPTSLWGQGGVPNTPINWVEKGVVKNLFYDRYWAMKAGKQPTAFPGLMTLEGGTGSVNDLIKATDRGLLVTRFWYVRMVNPQTVQLTGLTRDGLFLIEKGEVTRPVINLRFNESPVRMLQNAKLLGRVERAQGAESQMLCPPVQATDFTFSSISDAV